MIIENCCNATIHVTLVKEDVGPMNSSSRLTFKTLVAQCSNIFKKQLLLQLEIDEIQHKCYSKGESGYQVRRAISSSPHTEIRYQEKTGTLKARATDLKEKIPAKLDPP